MNLSIFEAGMLFCFGCAWPLSIMRSIKSRSTKGKSLIFLFVVEAGYISGIIHKVMFSTDIVMALYILNAVLVATDIVLYFRNQRIERMQAEA